MSVDSLIFKLVNEVPREARIKFINDHANDLSDAKPGDLDRIASVLLKESSDEAKEAYPVIGDHPHAEELETVSLEEARYVEDPI